MLVKENDERSPAKQITHVYQNVTVETMKLWLLSLQVSTNAVARVRTETWSSSAGGSIVVVVAGETFSGGLFSYAVFYFIIFFKGCLSAERAEQDEKGKYVTAQGDGEFRFSHPNVVGFCWNEIGADAPFLDMNEMFLAVLKAWRILQHQFVPWCLLQDEKYDAGLGFSAFYQDKKKVGKVPPGPSI